VHRRRLAQVQELGHPLGVVAVVLARGAEDQPQLAGVGDQDTGGQRLEQVVVVAVAAAGLVADLKLIRQPLEEAQHLFQTAHTRPLDDLPGLAKHTNGDMLGVDVEPDVQHGNLLKSECARTSTSWFHDTRLTEASF
jgi:hypothetical protein